MKFLNLKTTIGAILLLATAAGAAHADLVLSGQTSGFFQPSANPNTTIINTPDGSSASFLTGVPLEDSFKSGVLFEGHSFADIASGDTFSFGLLDYRNGITQIGTSSGSALLDFYLNFDDPAVGSLFLTTITFGIDATINTPSNLIPDAFTASFTQPPPMMIAGQWVKFTINDLPASVDVAENSNVNLGSVTVTYLSPVPEPATYGLFGAIGLMGVVAYRRFKRKQTPSATGSFAVPA